MFHVEHRLAVEIELASRIVPCGTFFCLQNGKQSLPCSAGQSLCRWRRPSAAAYFSGQDENDRLDLFHVERIQLTAVCRSPKTVSQHNGTAEAEPHVPRGTLPHHD